MTSNSEEFKAKFFAAFADADTHGVDSGLAYAVAALETGRGRGLAFQLTNNLFSIHVGAFDGIPTGYWDGKTHYKTSQGEDLRGYSKWADSISDFCRGLATRPFLHDAYVKAQAGNAPAFFAAMQASGYAGDPNGHGAKYAAGLAATYQDIA